MDLSEIQRLKFRRQYLIVPHPVECSFQHKIVNINKTYTLYAHVDLLVTEYVQNEIKIILLGDMFDYEDAGKLNTDILKDLYDVNFEKFLEKTSRYSGRFVLIYLSGENMWMTHDATATRKIYFARIKEEFWCASQPHLLAKVTGLKKTTNKSKLAFYNSPDFNSLNNSNIGDTTYYDEINQLLPNHYLLVNELKIVRYWPADMFKSRPFTEVAEECTKIIKGYMANMAFRYNLMLPVTAGNDSRALLAATYDFRNQVYYYINKDSRLGDNYSDFVIPEKLFEKVNLEFHVINPFIPIDKDFEKIYFENNEYASLKYLPHIYNYYLNFSDKVNLPGNTASTTYWLDKLRKKNVTGLDLAILNEVSQYEFAVDCYDKWLSGCSESCHRSNIPIANLFYWEERLGNWGTQTQLEKDIAQEDFNPFNSRLLVSLILSVKLKYNENPDFLVHRYIIKKLWPELLEVPINPSFRNRMLKALKMIGLLNLMYKINSYFKYSSRES